MTCVAAAVRTHGEGGPHGEMERKPARQTKCTAALPFPNGCRSGSSAFPSPLHVSNLTSVHICKLSMLVLKLLPASLSAGSLHK